MKRAFLPILLAAAVSAAGPAFSEGMRPGPLGLEIASTTQTVPAMANAGGLSGATFQTFVALMNPTTLSYTIRVTLYDAAGVSYAANIAMAPGEQKTYQNFLDAVFHFSGAGSVVFQSGLEVGGSLDNLFIVSAEVYTAGGAGRFGTTVPALSASGSASRSVSVGILVDGGNRTNVGCYNDSAKPNHVDAQVLDGSGHLVTTVRFDLAAHAWNQQAVPSPVNGGYVSFQPVQPAVCYAVVVNNTTNDGRLIPAAEAP